MKRNSKFRNFLILIAGFCIVAFIFTPLSVVIVFLLVLICFLMINYRGRVLNPQALDELEEQAVDLSSLSTKSIPNMFENEYCLVKLSEKGVICAKEKISNRSDGYCMFMIAKSYRTSEIWDAFYDLFDNITKYQDLLSLCHLLNINYEESFIEYEKPKINQEAKKDLEAEPTKAENEPSMPVLKISQETVETDTEPEIKYNNDREVDI